MISSETKLYNKLRAIDKELIEISNPMQLGIDIKLKRSYENYTDNIIANCNYILSRNNYKAFMNIDRYNKRKEKLSDEEKTKWGFIEVN